MDGRRLWYFISSIILRSMYHPQVLTLYRRLGRPVGSVKGHLNDLKVLIGEENPNSSYVNTLGKGRKKRDGGSFRRGVDSTVPDHPNNVNEHTNTHILSEGRHSGCIRQGGKWRVRI